MITSILQVVGATAGLGGLALGVFLIVFRDIIRKNVFPTLSKPHAYYLLRLVAILVWSVALAGLLAWTYLSRIQQASLSNVTPTQPRERPRTEDKKPAARETVAGNRASLLIYADLPCTIQVDGKLVGRINQEQQASVPVGLGEHVVRATTDGGISWETTVSVNESGQLLVKAALQEARRNAAAKTAAAEAQAKADTDQAKALAEATDLHWLAGLWTVRLPQTVTDKILDKANEEAALNSGHKYSLYMCHWTMSGNVDVNLSFVDLRAGGDQLSGKLEYAIGPLRCENNRYPDQNIDVRRGDIEFMAKSNGKDGFVVDSPTSFCEGQYCGAIRRLSDDVLEMTAQLPIADMVPLHFHRKK
jgi:hypothetical protein